MDDRIINESEQPAQCVEAVAKADKEEGAVGLFVGTEVESLTKSNSWWKFWPNEFLSIYVFISILLKNILLLGYITDATHDIPHIRTALSLVFRTFAYRPIYYIGAVLLVIWIVYLFKDKARIISVIALDILVSFLLLVNLWYLRGFNTLPSLYELKAGGNLTDTITGFVALTHITDLIFFLDIPILITYAILRRKAYRHLPRKFIFSAMCFCIGLLSFLIIAPVANNLTSKTPINWIYYKLNAMSTVSNISPLGYEFYSSKLYLVDKNEISLSQKQVQEIEQWFAAKQENLGDNEYSGIYKGKNLLVIQVESLENFVLNQRVEGQEITPNINKLLGNSLYFKNYYEQVGGGNSSDADLMTNASVYPIRMGTTFINNPITSYNSLPQIFKQQGYFTSVFHPDDAGMWNWKPALTSMGFDKLYDSSNYKCTEKIIMGISDREYLNQVEPIILKQKQPFYTFMVTLSSHTPFNLPAQYQSLKLSEKYNNTKLGGYFQCVNYMDTQLGNFLNNLDKDGLLENTIVAIYGDHEGVHKYFQNDIYKISGAESWMIKNDKHIPLIIYKKHQQPKVIETTGGQVDILPTLGYLMGLDKKQYLSTAMGRNLLNTNKNYALLRDMSIKGTPSEGDKKLATQGMEIADLIIRGNYFKKNRG